MNKITRYKDFHLDVLKEKKKELTELLLYYEEKNEEGLVMFTKNLIKMVNLAIEEKERL